MHATNKTFRPKRITTMQANKHAFFEALQASVAVGCGAMGVGSRCEDVEPCVSSSRISQADEAHVCIDSIAIWLQQVWKQYYRLSRVQW